MTRLIPYLTNSEPQRCWGIEGLDDEFKQKALTFLGRLVFAGIYVMVIETIRTHERQAWLLRNNRSWTDHSKHLVGRAIDVCPIEEFRLNGSNKLHWDAADPIWTRIGEIGEQCGLTWGGRWKQRDMGHFEG